MGSCYLSSTVLQSQTTITELPIYTYASRLQVCSFDNPFPSSPSLVFLHSFVECCSTKSNNYYWVSYTYALRFQVCPFGNPFPSSPPLVTLASYCVSVICRVLFYEIKPLLLGFLWVRNRAKKSYPSIRIPPLPVHWLEEYPRSLGVCYRCLISATSLNTLHLDLRPIWKQLVSGIGIKHYH